MCGPFSQRITEDPEKALLHDAVTITRHPISYKTISLCWITVKFLVHTWPIKLTLIKHKLVVMTVHVASNVDVATKKV